MEGHPTAEDFECLLQRSPRPSNASRNAWVVRHLLAGCGECRSTLQKLKGARTLLGRLLDLPTAKDQESPSATRYNYEWAFARAERALRSYPARGSYLQKLSDLTRLSEGEQIRQARANERFADPELIRVLIEHSHNARYRSPRKTLHLSLLARLAATACTAERARGAGALADMQAEAWSAFANAQRICGHLFEAEESFSKAFEYHASGTGSPRVRAVLLSQLCALRISQRQLEDALDLSAETERISREIGDLGLQAGALLQEGTALLYGGEAARAIDVFRRAIQVTDREEDPHLCLAAHHNLVRCYIDLDQPEEALSLFYEARDLYQSCSDPLILLRATWQEGQLLREVGHLRNAEAALLRVREGFEEQGLAYESAVVCLDLGEVYWKLGQVDELRRALTQAVPIFRSLKVEREVLASLLRLQQAAELEPSELPG